MILMVDGLQQAGSKVQDSGRPHSTLASFYLSPHSLPTNQPTPREQIYGKHIHSMTRIEIAQLSWKFWLQQDFMLTDCRLQEVRGWKGYF